MGSLPQRFWAFAYFTPGASGLSIRAMAGQQSTASKPVEPIAAFGPAKTLVSIGILAWNEEETIGPALEALFQQTLFWELRRRQLRCEVLCVANGCTDQTVSRAERTLAEQGRYHPMAEYFSCRVVNLLKRGKLNAWNQFVHHTSAPDAQFLILMDADITLPRRDTLWRLLRGLQKAPRAHITVDQPCKDFSVKRHKSLRQHFSLQGSRLTEAAPAQLCAQLYCIRSGMARSIYLPRDLSACEDGFIKALACTDLLSHEVLPERILLVPGTEHYFEAYTSPRALLRNRKRQIMGQTIVHLLVDQYLPSLTLPARLQLGETLRELDQVDPFWLRRLIAGHLERARWFWRLYPGLASQPFKRLGRLRPLQRLTCLPAAAANCALGLVAAAMASHALKRGSTDYWPQARRSRPPNAPLPKAPVYSLAGTDQSIDR